MDFVAPNKAHWRRDVGKTPWAIKASTARIEFDSLDRLFFGRIAGIRDIVTFHGRTVGESETAFKEAVDDYLATCARLGDAPNKPYSGKVTLRIPPEVHAAIATAAETSGKSLNKWISDTLEHTIHGC